MLQHKSLLQYIPALSTVISVVPRLAAEMPVSLVVVTCLVEPQELFSLRAGPCVQIVRVTAHQHIRCAILGYHFLRT